MALDIKIGSYALGNYIDTFSISQESRLNQISIPRRDGFLSDDPYKTGISISMGGLIYNDSSDDSRTALNSLKGALSASSFVITVYSDRQITCKKIYFTASYEESDLRRIRWEAEVSSDDYGFVAVNQTETENSQTASPQTNTHTNNGNLDTYPVVRITAGTDTIASGVRVDNLTNDKFFTYNATITTGNWIEIDTENLTVVDQDGTNKVANFQGDFFRLSAGDNSIKYTGTVSGATKPKLKLTYRDKYDGF